MDKIRTQSLLYFEIWFGILLFILLLVFLGLDIYIGLDINSADSTAQEDLGSYLNRLNPLERNLFITLAAIISLFAMSKIDYVPCTFLFWLGSMYIYYRYGFVENGILFTIIWIASVVLSIKPAKYANNHFDELLSSSDSYRNSSSRLVRLRWSYVFNRYFACCYGLNILLSMLCLQIIYVFKLLKFRK